MKNTFRIAFLCLMTLTRSFAAERAELQLVSTSVQVFQGIARQPLTGLEFLLEVSSFSDRNRINNELASAAANHGFTHDGIFFMHDPVFQDVFIFPFVLDVEPFSDLNDNGLIDFFDRDLPVANVTTEGRYQRPDGAGDDFTATWNRAAGATEGIVVLSFPSLGLDFRHPFALFVYTGEYQFDRNGTNLLGTVALTNVLDSNDTLTGPLNAEIVNTNSLRYDFPTWNGPEGAVYTPFDHDSFDLTGTNLLSLLEFEDGFPATTGEDYLLWLLLLTATDADSNGVPDILEEQSGPAGPPALNITRVPEGFEITITGTPGRTYVLEAAETAPTPNWEPIHTVTLASPESRTIVANDGGRKFFRLREQ